MIVGVSRALRESRMQGAYCGARACDVAGAHHGERRAAPSRGDRRRIPAAPEPGEYDEVRTIEEGAAREMARRLGEGGRNICGTSSGLNVTAALQLAQGSGRGSTVATVAVDSGFKYLAGDLYQQ